MPKPAIEAETLVRDVMDDHPETVAVFVRRRMHCPGCLMAPFMTVAEAATSYGIEPTELLADLRAGISLAETGEQA